MIIDGHDAYSLVAFIYEHIPPLCVRDGWVDVVGPRQRDRQRYEERGGGGGEGASHNRTRPRIKPKHFKSPMQVSWMIYVRQNESTYFH